MVLPAFVNISDDGIIGVHMTKEEQRELNFGMIFPGAATTKTLNLTRGSSPPAQVNMTLTVPKGTEQGRYSGSATVRYITSYGASLMHLFSGGRT